MTSRWVEIGLILRQDGVHSCLVLNALGEKDARCTGGFDEGHHGVVEGQKSETRKEWRHFLDHPVNYCPACHSCNTNRVGDADEARYQYFLLQVKRYGEAQMKAWLNQAPKEIKERPLFKRCWKELN